MRKSLFHFIEDQDADFMLSLYQSYYGDIADIVRSVVKEKDKVEDIIQESILNLIKKINNLRKLASDEKKLCKEILRVTKWTAKLSRENLKIDPKVFLNQSQFKPQNKSSNWVFIEKAIQKKELGKMIQRFPADSLFLLCCKFGLQKSDGEIMERFDFKDKEEMEQAFKTVSNLLLAELEKEYEDK